jgi:hypothetical protein
MIRQSFGVIRENDTIYKKFEGQGKIGSYQQDRNRA